MSPNAQSKIRAAAATDCGPVRSRNEDAHLIDVNSGLVALSDGMGGHQDGDLASRTVLAMLFEKLSKTSGLDGFDQPRIDGALRAAHESLGVLNRGRSPRDAMGATIVGVGIRSDQAECHVFHVGDSRAFLWRRGDLRVLTRDHSAHEAWLSRGGAGQAPPRHVLTQALGMRGTFEPTVLHLSLEPGDLMMLCSDGVSDVLDEAAISRELERMDCRQLAGGCALIIQAALNAGTRDNVTVIIVGIDR